MLALTTSIIVRASSPAFTPIAIASQLVRKAVMDNMLFTSLHTWAMPGISPTTKMFAAISSSMGARGAERALRTSHDRRQLSRFRALRPAADRRVQKTDSGVCELPGNVGYRRASERRHLDIGAHPCAAHDTLVAERGVEARLFSGQACEHQIGGIGDLSGAFRGHATRLAEPVPRLLRNVEPVNRATLPKQPARHRTTHVAETYHSDIHGPLLRGRYS